jgi:hypothetical protein
MCFAKNRLIAMGAELREIMVYREFVTRRAHYWIWSSKPLMKLVGVEQAGAIAIEMRSMQNLFLERVPMKNLV